MKPMIPRLGEHRSGRLIRGGFQLGVLLSIGAFFVLVYSELGVPGSGITRGRWLTVLLGMV
jgi:hypothetical protein